MNVDKPEFEVKVVFAVAVDAIPVGASIVNIGFPT